MTDEEKAIEELKAMTAAELAKVPADIFRWECCVKGCEHFTKVKSFATFPLVLYGEKWVNLQTQIYFCGKHWRQRLTLLASAETSLKVGPGSNHAELIKVAEI